MVVGIVWRMRGLGVVGDERVEIWSGDAMGDKRSGWGIVDRDV